MINALYLDPRCYKIDLMASPYWKPERYGIKIDLHPDAFNIPKLGINPKYKIIIASEIWEILMRKTLEYLRNKGLKIVLMAREPIKYGSLIDAMFKYERFKYNGSYYFKPDAVFAAGQVYADLWKGKAKTYLTGYPRWDWYLDAKSICRKDILSTYGLQQNKKIIFMPSFPPYHFKRVDGKDTMIDLFDEREAMLEEASRFAKHNSEYQFVAKIHPMSMKCYRKGTGKGNEVKGLLEQYLKSPTDYFKVVSDNRMSGNIAKELIMVSDIVVGYNSTMMLEAAMMGEPCINVQFGKCLAIESPYTGVFKTATKEDDLYNLLEECKSNRWDFVSMSDKAKDVAKQYLGDIDGECCKRVCDAIKDMV